MRRITSPTSLCQCVSKLVWPCKCSNISPSNRSTEVRRRRGLWSGRHGGPFRQPTTRARGPYSRSVTHGIHNREHIANGSRGENWLIAPRLLAILSSSHHQKGTSSVCEPTRWNATYSRFSRLERVLTKTRTDQLSIESERMLESSRVRLRIHRERNWT